jgi:hypothetical protein
MRHCRSLALLLLAAPAVLGDASAPASNNIKTFHVRPDGVIEAAGLRAKLMVPPPVKWV